MAGITSSLILLFTVDSRPVGIAESDKQLVQQSDHRGFAVGARHGHEMQLRRRIIVKVGRHDAQRLSTVAHLHIGDSFGSASFRKPFGHYGGSTLFSAACAMNRCPSTCVPDTATKTQFFCTCRESNTTELISMPVSPSVASRETL